MRGIGHTLSRHPKARAFLAGAAILAGAFTSAAHGQTSGLGAGTGAQTTDQTRPEEAASANLRLSHAGSPDVAFPQPLHANDAALMRRIFVFQEHGDIASAIRSANELENPLLLGSLLAQRYLSRRHRSTTDDLLDWLRRYADEPDAPAVRALLVSRQPRGTTNRAATPQPTPAPAEPDQMPEDIDPPRNDIARDPGLDRIVLDRAQRGNTTSALRLITTRRNISPAYASQLRAEVAHVLFTRNEDADALRVARTALSDAAPADRPALAYYVGGLAAWRLNHIEQAQTLFEDGTSAPTASANLRAAMAFWASRASRVQHDPVSTVKWLRAAAEERLTFHGLLARRILHLDTGILSSRELIAQPDVDAVAATKPGWRAFALLQIGQTSRAEAELRSLWSDADANPVFGRSLMLVAAAAGMTDCSAQMASLLQEKDGRRHEELRFPMPKLHPAGGFSIDPTLVYALTRLESNFDPTAVSPAGARGLMQIMPATAQYITGNLLYAAGRLHEPASNLDIGQRYIAYLAQQDGIDNDLLRILASYNSGPGSFTRWATDLKDHDDPLLFIEAIPLPETRAFVQHALIYSWIYAARLHLPAPSLDQLAAGEFPRFTPANHERKMALKQPQMH